MKPSREQIIAMKNMQALYKSTDGDASKITAEMTRIALIACPGERAPEDVIGDICELALQALDMEDSLKGVLDGCADAVRVREGGGPEDLAMSIAVTMIALMKKAEIWRGEPAATLSVYGETLNVPRWIVDVTAEQIDKATQAGLELARREREACASLAIKMANDTPQSVGIEPGPVQRALYSVATAIRSRGLETMRAENKVGG